MKDYYKLLRIDRKATTEEIKKVYRELSKKYHPDTHSAEDKEFFTNKMSEINAAWTILGDIGKRQQYDFQLYAYEESDKLASEKAASKNTTNKTPKPAEPIIHQYEKVDIYTISDADLKEISIFRILLGKKYAKVGIPNKYMFTDLNRIKISRNIAVNKISYFFGQALDFIHAYLWWMFSFNKYKAMIRIFMLIGFLLVTNMPVGDMSKLYATTSTIASNLAVAVFALRLVYVFVEGSRRGIMKLYSKIMYR